MGLTPRLCCSCNQPLPAWQVARWEAWEAPYPKAEYAGLWPCDACIADADVTVGPWTMTDEEKRGAHRFALQVLAAVQPWKGTTT